MGDIIGNRTLLGFYWIIPKFIYEFITSFFELLVFHDFLDKALETFHNIFPGTTINMEYTCVRNYWACDFTYSFFKLISQLNRQVYIAILRRKVINKQGARQCSVAWNLSTAVISLFPFLNSKQRSEFFLNALLYKLSLTIW